MQLFKLEVKPSRKFLKKKIFIGTPKTYRFRKANPISINPPSYVLHVSNLVKEVCQDETKLRELFGKYGNVEGLKFILEEKNKNMCLVKMATMEESLKTMSFLHDTDFGGRKIQISFTRSRL